MELAIETLWSAGACGAVPWAFQTVVRVEGVDGVAGVELHEVSEASNRNMYEINKQCKPLLIQFALEDQLQVVQLLDSKFDSTKPAQQLELTPKPWWFNETKMGPFFSFPKRNQMRGLGKIFKLQLEKL